MGTEQIVKNLGSLCNLQGLAAQPVVSFAKRCGDVVNNPGSTVIWCRGFLDPFHACAEAVL
jgi:hypothetical protein